jgi:uncharacterized membrane protein YfhO
MSTKDTTKKPETVDFFENLGNKAVFLALGIAFLIVMYVYWDFIFLNKAFLFKDIGSDSINETWPLLYHLSEQLYKYGIIYWSHQFGMGDTFYQYYGDPFTLLAILSGKNNVQYATAYTQILAILLTVFFSFKYLKLLNLKNFTAIFGSLTFAFSGFVILSSSGWLMAPLFFYFTLGLYSVEAFLNNKKLIPIAITALLLGCNNAISGVQIFMFLSFYFLVRQIELNDLKFVFKSIVFKQILFTLLFILGFLVASVFVFNYMDLVLTSGRAEVTSQTTSLSGTNPFALMPGEEFTSLIARFFSNDLLGSGINYKGWMNYFESPLTYVGLIPFLLSFYGLFYGDKRQRIIHRFLFILVVIGFAFPYVRYAFWGFQLNYFRIYSMFLAFFLFFIGIRTFNKIITEKFLDKKFIYISIFVVLIILFKIIPQPLINASSRNAILLFVVVYYLLLFLISKEKPVKEIKIAFLVLLTIELSVFTNATVNHRTHLSTKELRSKTGYFDTTVDALNYLRETDPGYYRIAKTYASGPAMHGSLNDGLIQNFMGLVSYSQFQKKGYLDFLYLAGFFNKEDPNELKWSYKLSSDFNFIGFAGTKYLIYKQPFNYDSTFLKPVKTFGEYGILKTKLTLPLFYTHKRMISNSEIMKYPAEKRRLLMFYNTVLSDSDTKNVNLTPAKTDTTVYRIDTLLSQISLLNHTDVTINTFNPDQITVTASVNEKSILCSSIPDHNGWKLMINGKEVKKMLVNGGLIGCELFPGKHTVELLYTPVKLKLGIMCSVVSLILLVLLLFIAFKMQKKSNLS